MPLLPEHNCIPDQPLSLVTQSVCGLEQVPQMLGLEPLTGKLAEQASKACVTTGGEGVHLGHLVTVKCKSLSSHRTRIPPPWTWRMICNLYFQIVEF